MIHPNIAHGFFGRKGGISGAQFTSLNTGQGSHDEPENVFENRRRVAETLGTIEPHLISNYQIHSAEVIIVDGPWTGERSKADGLVTKTPGIALSALGADCGPVLFYEPEAGVVAACHAGWGGALKGITTSTILTMESLGAQRSKIVAVLGPCISQENYEVGHDFRDTFVAENEAYDRFFKLGPEKTDNSGISPERRPHFDLKRFILSRLRDVGVTQIDALPDCTYGLPDEYFSYRYNTHQGVSGYGRNISAIMLKE